MATVLLNMRKCGHGVGDVRRAAVAGGLAGPGGALQANCTPGDQLQSKYGFRGMYSLGLWVGAGAEMVWATYGALLSPEGWLDQEAHESDLRGSRGVALAGALMIFMGVANFCHTARPPHAGPCMTAVSKVQESLQWLALALKWHPTCTLAGQCRSRHQVRGHPPPHKASAPFCALLRMGCVSHHVGAASPSRWESVFDVHV